MTPSELREYTQLRATIRERGTARVYVFVVGVAVWATLVIAVATLSSTPLATLIPLLVLAASFEGVFALHVGVERIGRYLAVFHSDAWEAAAAGFGRPRGAIGLDPLFAAVYGIAAVSNLLPALLQQPTRQEMLFVGGAHALFIVRLAYARMAAPKQRAIDAGRFQELRDRPDSART
jgi:hypothetical protein